MVGDGRNGYRPGEFAFSLFVRSRFRMTQFSCNSSSRRIAFAIGFINTPSFSLARLIGGLISLYYTRHSTSNGPASHLEHFGLIIVASGFVLGEGFSSVVGLLLKSGGYGNPVSCWGCGLGGGGYCASCP